MNQPHITAKITFLGASEDGRDVLPANLLSGQYRPHVVIDPNQLRAVTVDTVPEQTYFGVTEAYKTANPKLPPQPTAKTQ